MNDAPSRRRFLRGVAAGAAAAGLSRCLSDRPASAEQKGDETQIPTYTRICPQHFELIQQRSENAHRKIARAAQRENSRPVVVAAAQMANHCDAAAGKQENLRRMQQYIGSAARQGVQVIVFPELCLCGYLNTGSPRDAARVNHSLADTPGKSPFLEQLQSAAKTARIIVAFGFSEKSDDKYYNSIGLIDADGAWLGTRRKNPLSPHPFELDSFHEPDASLRIAVFTTKVGTVGLANCFDGEFPESIRGMRLAGAELLLWSNAGTGDPTTGHSSRINAAGSYAQSNRMWVVCCNAVADRFYGTSVVIGPSGEPLVVLPTNQEALGVARIDLSLSENWDLYRSRLDPIWGDSQEN